MGVCRLIPFVLMYKYAGCIYIYIYIGLCVCVRTRASSFRSLKISIRYVTK